MTGASITAPGAGTSTSDLQAATYGRLEDLPSSYGDLFELATGRSVFSSLAWFRNFVDTVQVDMGGPLRIVGVETRDARRAVGVMLTQGRPPAGSRLAPRELASLSNYYSPYFEPIVDSARPDRAAIVAHLVRAMCGSSDGWDVIDLKPLPVESPVFADILAAFRARGILTQPYLCFGNWYLEVQGRAYREVFEALPSRMKNTVTRKRKALDRSGRARFTLITDAGGLEEGVAAYEQVYAASWKTPEPFPRFIPGLMRTCAEAGWLRLGIIHVDDTPAAAQLWIVNDGVASIYKLAYDERFLDLSVGSILTARLLEHAIDVDKVREVDYLSGDDSYKRDWMSHRRERWGIMAFNSWSARGLAGAAMNIGGRPLARVARRAVAGLRRGR